MESVRKELRDLVAYLDLTFLVKRLPFQSDTKSTIILMVQNTNSWGGWGACFSEWIILKRYQDCINPDLTLWLSMTKETRLN